MKIKEFIKEKLENFTIFVNSELSKVDVDDDKKAVLMSDMEKYTKDINLFIQSMMMLAGYDPHVAVKIFLAKYSIDVTKIMDDIDSANLIRYLEMFVSVLI